MKTAGFISVLFIIFLFYCPAGAKTFQGRVVEISDGDTIKVIIDGEQIKIRLYGIDTPEKKQAFGQAAKKQLSSLLTSLVEVEVKDIDRYGRTVGIITTSTGINVNEEMVKIGYAWVYRKYCRLSFCINWLALENNAKKKKIGLWTQRAVPPWEWRKIQRQKR